MDARGPAPFAHRRRSSRLSASLLALALFGLPLAPLFAQDETGAETPREIRQKAMMALSQGAYEDAIPLLQQLIEMFGKSTKETTIAQMEGIYYTVSCCYFFLGQFSEARDAFEVYLKKYRTGIHAPEAMVYIGDSYRFDGNIEKALKTYFDALRKYQYYPDLRADIYSSVARCYLAQDKWDKAMPWLLKVYSTAPDYSRRNWAATLLTTAYLKERKLPNVYRLIPYLLLPNSFASRSVALNMAALETGDELFGDEKYRDALWIYRLVYPHDVLMVRSEEYLEYLNKKAERLRRVPDNPRPLMRCQESIAELEGEIKALASIENYDVELTFRMARAYMEIWRYREARDLFIYLYETAEKNYAEQALYLAFTCCTHIRPWDQAFELGREYMKVYPAGEYYDRITITMGQMYAKLQDWPRVIEVLTTALQVSPRHEEAAECMFLIGYASFMEEKFADAVEWLCRMNKTYPGNPREPDGIYWTGMALMFDKNFEEAAIEFDDILLRFPACQYVEDTSFRRAVCDYGMGKFKEAGQRLKVFVAQYPDSKLAAEAYMMLGDVAGVFGELEEAVRCFQQVSKYENVNIEFYNYSAFRCGEMLNELNNFAGLVEHFKEYIRQNREGSNIPLAMYWVASGMWNLNEREAALEFFRQGIEKYGADRKSLGIDLILEEWVGKTRGVDKTVAKSAWKNLEDMLKKAEAGNQPALALRLKRIFLFEPEVTEERKKALMDSLMKEENITNASPGVLELMIDEASKRSNQTFAVKACEQTVKDFPETDYALSARMILARHFIETKQYDKAIRHLNVVKEVFATSGEAAEALLLLGDLFMKENKFEEADKSFRNILDVRDWRGPLWPAALYGRGECARAQREYEKACAYYERIYVMYGGYKEWAAKAYLARAECLIKLAQYIKAGETLQEMLSLPDLQKLPQAETAQRLLDNVKRRVQ
jgi:TolA-binding protein